MAEGGDAEPQLPQEDASAFFWEAGEQVVLSLSGTSQLLGQMVKIQIQGVHPRDSVSVWEWNPTTITLNDSPWTLLQVWSPVTLGQMAT